MTLWTASDVHPPLYFWLLYAFVHLGGESEFSARFVSLLCGTATVTALYALGKALLGRQIALWAAVLLAFSRFHVWWSQEMRMYIVATLCGVLSLYTLVRWLQAERWLSLPAGMRLQRRRPRREALLYVIATAAGLYTLYLFVALILIENIFVLTLLLSQQRSGRQSVADKVDRSLLWRWVVLQVAVFGLFMPWLALALPRMHSWSVATPFDFTVFLCLYATLLTVGISTYIERYAWLVAPYFLVLGVALASIWRSSAGQKATPAEPMDSKKTAYLLSLFLIVPPLIVYALTQPRGLFYAPHVEARYLVLFAPAFYLLLAWSLVLLWQRARCVGLGALAFVVATFLWTLPGHYTGRYLRDEHQTMVRIIAAYAQPGDAVLLVSCNRYPIFGYYYERPPGDAACNTPEWRDRPPVYNLPQRVPVFQADNVEQELAPLAATHARLWLAQVDPAMQDPQGLVAKWLDEHYSRTLNFGFAHNALTLYAPAGTAAKLNPQNLAPQYPLVISVGPGTALLGYDLPTTQFRPDDVVHLALYYSAQVETTIQVRMVDQPGRVLEQRESTLTIAPVARQQFDFKVYARTPRGVYHFELAPLENRPGQIASFGTVRIAATKSLPKAGQPSVALSAALEEGIELLGYTLRDAYDQPVQTMHAGEALTLDLYWRAKRKIAHNYTVFTHLVGQAYNPATAGPVWAGHDSEPLAGGYPTSQWFPDSVVVDRHTFTVDPQAPVGDYELEAGMYLLETMTRLSVLDAEGRALDKRILLGRFQVVQ